MASAAHRVLITASMHLVERGLIPDFVVHFVIRFIVASRAAAAPPVPCKLFKDSCCLFPDAKLPLDDAEDSMLELTCQRAQLRDSQRVLDLGCSWGSLSLYIAAKYPLSHVTAICSNMAQKLFVSQQCRQRGLANVQVMTANHDAFGDSTQYDRVLAVERLGDPQSYTATLQQIGSWLKADGRCFAQVVCHQHCSYFLQETAIDCWMLPHMQPGSTLPSMNLLEHFQDAVVLEKQWYINGQNYSKTVKAWLRHHDKQRKAILCLLQESYGAGESHKLYAKQRLAYMIQCELFRCAGGTEWGVGHYLFCNGKS
ncbi:hypothetical protein WJX77_012025 [Trebouxia sp. C0004]